VICPREDSPFCLAIFFQDQLPVPDKKEEKTRMRRRMVIPARYFQPLDKSQEPSGPATAFLKTHLLSKLAAGI